VKEEEPAIAVIRGGFAVCGRVLEVLMTMMSFSDKDQSSFTPTHRRPGLVGLTLQAQCSNPTHQYEPPQPLFIKNKEKCSFHLSNFAEI